MSESIIGFFRSEFVGNIDLTCKEKLGDYPTASYEEKKQYFQNCQDKIQLLWKEHGENIKFTETKAFDDKVNV